MAIEVTLMGKSGRPRSVSVTPDNRFRNPRLNTVTPEPSESIAITPEIPTPAELIADIMPAFNEAWKANRQRLIDYLGEDLDVSDGVILHALATAIEMEYAPRIDMNASQWQAFISDLTTGSYFNIEWLRRLKTQIERKYEDRRIQRTALKSLLMEVDAILAGGVDSV